MKYQIIFSLLLTTLIQAAGAPALGQTTEPVKTERMLRFWRGFKQDDVPRAQFEASVNARLIPQTIVVAGGRGLSAYLPSFFPETKPDFLPDEVAIVDYVDEKTYNAIRSTEEGKAYGALHFEPGFFAKQNAKGFKSGSLVAVPYTGTVEINPDGRAYMLGDVNLNWQLGVSARRTLLPARDLTADEIQAYFARLENHFSRLGVKGAVAVVDPRYLMIMINAADQPSAQALDSAFQALEAGRLIKFDHVVFESQNFGETRLAPGAGINVRFQP